MSTEPKTPAGPSVLPAAAQPPSGLAARPVSAQLEALLAEPATGSSAVARSGGAWALPPPGVPALDLAPTRTGPPTDAAAAPLATSTSPGAELSAPAAPWTPRAAVAESPWAPGLVAVPAINTLVDGAVKAAPATPAGDAPRAGAASNPLGEDPARRRAQAELPSGHSRRQERVRLLLAGLVGALLASLVFLTLELVRKPSGRESPGLSALGRGNLVAVPTTPGAVPYDPDADPDAQAPGSQAPGSQAPGAQAPGSQAGSPFGQGLGSLLGRMQQQMKQAFGGTATGSGGGGFTFRFGGDDTSLDAEDAGDAIIVIAKVKDAVTDKFDIQIEGRSFTLRGQRKLGGGGMLGTMSFQQSITLPADVDQSKMTSEVKDGVLRVRLPKK